MVDPDLRPNVRAWLSTQPDAVRQLARRRDDRLGRTVRKHLREIHQLQEGTRTGDVCDALASAADDLAATLDLPTEAAPTARPSGLRFEATSPELLERWASVLRTLREEIDPEEIDTWLAGCILVEPGVLVTPEPGEKASHRIAGIAEYYLPAVEAALGGVVEVRANELLGDERHAPVYSAAG